MPAFMRAAALRPVGAALALALLAGCAPSIQAPVSAAPTVAENTTIHQQLRDLPPPVEPIVAAVYHYTDQTGQFEASRQVQSLSRAVTQGASSILIKALQDAGDGRWFTVLEREGLDNLLKERQIIRETRTLYGEGRGDDVARVLPPLLFAGMLLEGGIISYDTDTSTGGFGARILGIGGKVEYRKDTAVVYLRAVSTQNGRVLASVNVSKTLYSVGVAADVFRYVASDEILELEAGFTSNEPEHVAIKQAIEKAVIALIVEAATPPRPRIKTRPSRASKERRLEAKGRRSQVKSLRGSKPGFD